MQAKDRKINIFPGEAILSWMTDNLTGGSRKQTDQWERSAYALKYLVELHGEEGASQRIREAQEKTESEWEAGTVDWVRREKQRRAKK